MIKYVFPFERVKKGSKIIIYGAGAVGVDFLKMLELTEYCSVVAVLDRDRAGGETHGYTILPSESISDFSAESYDMVLLAIRETRKNVQRKAADFLLASGVPPEKLLMYDGRTVARDKFSYVSTPDDGRNAFRIAVVLHGTLGDYLVSTPIAYGLRKAVPDGLIIDYYIRTASAIIERMPFIDNLYLIKTLEEYNGYDAVLVASWIPYPLKLSLEKAKRVSPVLYDYLNDLIWHYDDLFHPELNYVDLNARVYANIIGKSRAELTNPRGILPYNKQTPMYTEFDVHSYEMLRGAGLSEKLYITLCDTVNADRTKSLKLWPKAYFNELTRLLKERYPEHMLVRVGDSGEIGEIENIDLDLCGKTTIDDAAVLLKQSVLHIGCEGGLVHMNHALNGVSVCLFGPTIPSTFAHDENINLRSNEPKACIHGCEHVKKKWSYGGCVIDYNAPYAPCMTSLTPEYVFEKTSEYLDKLPKLRYEQYGTVMPDKIEAIVGEGFDAALIYREGDEYILPLAKKLKSLIIIDKDLSEEPIIEEAPINMRYSQRVQSMGVMTEYGNLHNIPAAAGSYDLTVNYTMPKEEYPEFALRELARVTKPGGTFAVMIDSGELALYRVMIYGE